MQKAVLAEREPCLPRDRHAIRPLPDAVLNQSVAINLAVRAVSEFELVAIGHEVRMTTGILGWVEIVVWLGGHYLT